MSDAALLEPLIALADAAGRVVMSHYDAPAARAKADGSPVTLADTEAERLVLDGLARLAPDIPVISEEAHAAGRTSPTAGGLGEFWLVDPLDGTREFLSRNGEFTVNIALVRAGMPVLGIVAAPAIGHTYAAAGPGTAIRRAGDAKTPIVARPCPPEGATVIASRSHADEAALASFLQAIPVARRIAAGSSLKLCLIAAGEADLYPRLGPTMEWDIAAGHAILLAAGGSVVTLDGTPLAYGKPDLRNPHFVARGAGPAPSST